MQDAADAAPAAGGEVSSGDQEIDIAEFLYDPEEITVEAGTTVTWTNLDQAPHTATADDSSFDTGNLKRDDSADATFDEPGSYAYYCRFHPFMKATVTVE